MSIIFLFFFFCWRNLCMSSHGGDWRQNCVLACGGPTCLYWIAQAEQASLCPSAFHVAFYEEGTGYGSPVLSLLHVVRCSFASFYTKHAHLRPDILEASSTNSSAVLLLPVEGTSDCRFKRYIGRLSRSKAFRIRLDPTRDEARTYSQERIPPPFIHFFLR